MARSASDATRFTATTPYASAKPQGQFTPSPVQMGHAAPSGETPQQKIARLRAAASRARTGKESTFDSVVRVGRRWADRAHRLTAYSLIGLTVISGVTASFAIGDMLMHNRRKRNEWLADQQAKHQVKINEARVAFNQGLADEDQILLLNQERTKVEAAELQKNRPGMISRIFSSAPKEEQQGGNLEVQHTATAAKEKVKDLGIVKAVEDKVEEHKWQKPQTVGAEAVIGGPLDKEAAASVLAVQEKSKSWTNWLLRR
ncbi:hypothetical protein M438DRAFT_281600 [Aureobasidium pullulans EXF-150]|uniref:Uncharacterized protein n=1 Tax=Aureobasidium pullulans EXF-150 TaxID=1043002 RepID=A0A074X4U9_AURPU|nr:uncharacterized protein M438DRAFT_281600 [Aureobasidium pullulans EXF-150]KEQ80540.1 hypothetical protein M438DRAFT_281600 [Aureobasidium pullulans EXF-150]